MSRRVNMNSSAIVMIRSSSGIARASAISGKRKSSCSVWLYSPGTGATSQPTVNRYSNPNVGCSFWRRADVGSFRAVSTGSAASVKLDAQVDDRASDSIDTGQWQGHDDAETQDPPDVSSLSSTPDDVEGVIVSQVDPVNKPRDNRPRLPTSIKKLNRLLSYTRTFTLDESDLEERFVKGRGPGGQAINKTNSSVSLTHLPTGIRIQAQPTRSREQNRKIARQILVERLDLLRARADAQVREVVDDGGDSEAARSQEHARDRMGAEKRSKKEKERELAGAWSKDEVRWEKERRRKANRAKKSKRKKGSQEEDLSGKSASDEED